MTTGIDATPHIDVVSHDGPEPVGWAHDEPCPGGAPSFFIGAGSGPLPSPPADDGAGQATARRGRRHAGFRGSASGSNSHQRPPGTRRAPIRPARAIAVSACGV